MVGIIMSIIVDMSVSFVFLVATLISLCHLRTPLLLGIVDLEVRECMMLQNYIIF